MKTKKRKRKVSVKALADKLYSVGCEAMWEQGRLEYRGQRLREREKALRVAWYKIAAFAIKASSICFLSHTK